MKKLFIVFALFILTSCSISGEMLKSRQYSCEGFDYQRYQQDRYQCEQDSYLYAAPTAQHGGLVNLAIAVDRRISRFEQCMGVKGYYRVGK